MKELSYTISQVSEKIGISAYTLRYYDKEGLLPVVKRSSSGKRIFEDSDLEFIAVIYCLKKTGMSLVKIREFIKWAEEGDSSLEQRYQMFVERREAIDQQIKDLLTYRECIDFKCNYYKNTVAQGSENSSLNLEDFPLNKIIAMNNKEV